MFPENGIAWDLLGCLIPNLHTLVVILILALITTIGFFLLFYSANESKLVFLYFNVLIRNMLCGFVVPIIVIIGSLFADLLASLLGVEIFNSEFSLSVGPELLLNQIAAFQIIGLCMASAGLVGYFHTFRNLIHKATTRLLYCLVVAAAGGMLLPGYMLMKYILRPF